MTARDDEEPELRPEPPGSPEEGVPDGTETPDLPLGIPPREDGDEDAPELPGFPRTDPTHG
jgi:hypothetical protein